MARERRWTALNDEWGDFLNDPELMHEAAKSELLPEEGRLRKFFTTSRCYFGLVAERVLGEQPRGVDLTHGRNRHEAPYTDVRYLRHVRRHLGLYAEALPDFLVDRHAFAGLDRDGQPVP